jgi:hypothetical protein
MKGFETCPKQYYHVNVLKQFPFEETEATRYGTEFHKAAEDFMRDGTPLMLSRLSRGSATANSRWA